MLYRLIFLSGPQTGQRVTVADAPMTFGTDPECEISVEDSECAKRHVEFTHRGAKLSVRDLGSMNHFLVNGRELTDAALKHGDIVEIGRTRLLVQCSVQAEVGRSEGRRKRQFNGLVLLVLTLAAASGTYWLARGGGARKEEPARPLAANPVVATNAPAAARVNGQVRAPATNLLPVLSPGLTGRPPCISATNCTVLAGSNLSFAVTASDPDSAVPASLTASELPPGAVFSPPVVSGLHLVSKVSWTPTTNDLGANVFSFTATDRDQMSASCTVRVDVKAPPPQPPTKRQLAEQRRALALAKLAVSGLPAATDYLLEALEIDPGFDQARIELAGVLEKRGMIRRAIRAWLDLSGNTLDSALRDRALKEQFRLKGMLEQLADRGVISITGHVGRMIGDARYADTRVLSLTLEPADRTPLDGDAVRVEATFFVEEPVSHAVVPATTVVCRVEGPWAAGQDRSLSVTFHPPGSSNQAPAYAGYVARAFFADVLQDACAKPEALLPDAERSRRTPR